MKSKVRLDAMSSQHMTEIHTKQNRIIAPLFHMPSPFSLRQDLHLCLLLFPHLGHLRNFIALWDHHFGFWYCLQALNCSCLVIKPCHPSDLFYLFHERLWKATPYSCIPPILYLLRRRQGPILMSLQRRGFEARVNLHCLLHETYT